MERSVGSPSTWLLENLDLIARGGHVLDVAAGRGRHSLLLARSGCNVHALDRDADALADLAARARASGVALTTQVVDLEHGPVSLGRARYDVVLVFNYLYRPLMPAIIDSLARGGVLLYETFTIGQAERGLPRNPAFLLQPGELRRLVAPLHVLREREGDFDGKLLASIAARRS